MCMVKLTTHYLGQALSTRIARFAVDYLFDPESCPLVLSVINDLHFDEEVSQILRQVIRISYQVYIFQLSEKAQNDSFDRPSRFFTVPSIHERNF